MKKHPFLYPFIFFLILFATTAAFAWQDVGYDAANFRTQYAGQGNSAWTVPQSSVRTYAFSIDAANHVMTVWFFIANGSKVSGTPVGTLLQIKIPGGFVAARLVTNEIRSWSDDEENDFAVAEVTPGATWINLYHDAYVGAPAVAGSNLWNNDPDCDTWVLGQISFPIQ